MEFLQMAINALFIVEGGKRERDIVEKLLSRMLSENDINIKAFSVCGNIHMLYKKIIEMGGDVNIREVLASLNGVSDKDKEILKSDLKFAYTYLIFDLDLQHYDISSPAKIKKGLTEVEEMLKHFQNETDGTIGKLYINYPMVESYRDHNESLSDYLNRTIDLDQCIHYKEIVGKRGDNKNFSKYSTSDLKLLSDFNLQKASYMVLGYASPKYKDYISDIGQDAIFKAEKEKVLDENQINVLNTSMLIPVDYKGKKYFENR